MTENRIITDYLEDILDAINKTSFFIKGMTEEQFLQDIKQLLQ